MMVMVVVVVIAPDGPEHPHSAIPNIAMLEIPAAAVMMMVVVVMMVIVWAARFILCVKKLCWRILVRNIIRIKAAHGIGNRLQQIRIGGSCRNRIG